MSHDYHVTLLLHLDQNNSLETKAVIAHKTFTGVLSSNGQVGTCTVNVLMKGVGTERTERGDTCTCTCRYIGIG